MTTITEIRRYGEIAGFRVEGHADYAPYGQDIVCASISVLTINTINSLDALTKCGFSQQVTENGLIVYEVEHLYRDAFLLLQSASIGYQSIAEQYPDYVKYVATSQ